MTFARKLFPHPLLTGLLVVIWLLLVNKVTLNAILFGLLLGTVIPFLTSPYWPQRDKLKNPWMVLEYIGVAFWDILVANVVVARLILFVPYRKLRPAWVAVPLDLRSPEAITVLAGTITLTPGTVSADLSSKGHTLLVHCLDAPEPDEVVAEIKHRYERRLKEIFE